MIQPKPNSPRSFWACTAGTVLSGLLFFCAAGCATDPEYAQKLASARSDGTGSEIVGVWVSKHKDMTGRSFKYTLLFRPDGTGHQFVKGSSDVHGEWEMTWHYAGSGTWQGFADGKGSNIPDYHFTVRYNGSALLLSAPKCMWNMVFVNSDNDAAVEEHLLKR